MPRYVLTGAPGPGRPRSCGCSSGRLPRGRGGRDRRDRARACIRRPEPWTSPGFADAIVSAAAAAEERLSDSGRTSAVFVDRSPVCTLALRRHLGSPVRALLRGRGGSRRGRAACTRRCSSSESRGSSSRPAARRISFEESLAFEELHERTYRELGFELIEVRPARCEAQRRRVMRGSGPARRRSPRPPIDGPCAAGGQTKAPRPVIARPTMSVFISRVPS